MTTEAVPTGRGLRDDRARAVLETVRCTYHAGRRLDMQALAAQTGVSRATIYRRLGSRETLLGLVLADEAERLARRMRAEVGGRGGGALLETFGRINAHLAATESLRRFLALERETGLRILTSSAGIVQPRMVGVIEAMIRDEVAAGAYVAPVAPDTLAFAVVRLGEAFIYQDAVAGIRGEIGRLAEVQAVLLGV